MRLVIQRVLQKDQEQDVAAFGNHVSLHHLA